FLTSLFRLPTRAARAIGGVGRRGWLVTGVAMLLIGLGAIAVFAGPDAAATIVAVPVLLTLVVAVPVAVVVGLVLVAPHVGHAIARAARFLWRPFDGLFRSAMRALGRAIRSVAMGIGRATRFVAVPIGHAIAIAATVVGRAVALVATRFA